MKIIGNMRIGTRLGLGFGAILVLKMKRRQLRRR
jgi:uncharacterized protein (UPF0254 family)